MARYYNKTRGTVPLTLNGRSVLVGGKSYIDIAESDEGAPALVTAVSKGILKRKNVAPPAVVAVVQELPPEPVVVPEPDPAVMPEIEPADVVEVADAESSDHKGRKKRRTEF